MPGKRQREKTNITISLDVETIEKLDELAWDSHRPISQWITDAVWEADKVKNATRKERDADK